MSVTVLPPRSAEQAEATKARLLALAGANMRRSGETLGLLAEHHDFYNPLFGTFLTTGTSEASPEHIALRATIPFEDLELVGHIKGGRETAARPIDLFKTREAEAMSLPYAAARMADEGWVDLGPTGICTTDELVGASALVLYAQLSSECNVGAEHGGYKAPVATVVPVPDGSGRVIAGIWEWNGELGIHACDVGNAPSRMCTSMEEALAHCVSMGVWDIFAEEDGARAAVGETLGRLHALDPAPAEAAAVRFDKDAATFGDAYYCPATGELAHSALMRGEDGSIRVVAQTMVVPLDSIRDVNAQTGLGTMTLSAMQDHRVAGSAQVCSGEDIEQLRRRVVGACGAPGKWIKVGWDLQDLTRRGLKTTAVELRMRDLATAPSQAPSAATVRATVKASRFKEGLQRGLRTGNFKRSRNRR